MTSKVEMGVSWEQVRWMESNRERISSFFLGEEERMDDSSIIFGSGLERVDCLDKFDSDNCKDDCGTEGVFDVGSKL